VLGCLVGFHGFHHVSRIAEYSTSAANASGLNHYKLLWTHLRALPASARGIVL
jgi:hypothetical protein